MNPRYFYIQIAPATEKSPGQIREGWFLVRDGKVVLCDADGKVAHGATERTLTEGQDALAVAKQLLRSRLSRPDFNRKLVMPPLGIA